MIFAIGVTFLRINRKVDANGIGYGCPVIAEVILGRVRRSKILNSSHSIAEQDPDGGRGTHHRRCRQDRAAGVGRGAAI
jgi:hypothetical protein